MNKLMFYLKNANTGVLLIRIALGVIFLYAGLYKIANMEMTVGFFGAVGIPAFLAYYVTYSELLGGLALILGIFTRIAALLMAINMLYAIRLLFDKGFSLANGGWEYNFVLALCCLGLAFIGSGVYSLERMILKLKRK